MDPIPPTSPANDLRSALSDSAPASGHMEDELWATAKKLEASFISEMLKAMKFGESRGAFGGGIGEDQFASFLRDAHADAIAERGGFGLAESLFRSMAGEK